MALKSWAAAAAAVHLFRASKAAATTAVGALPCNLSVGGMFMQADWIVKLVMIGLMLASVITWTVFVAKQLQLKRERAGALENLSVLVYARTFGDLPADLSNGELVREAKAELALSVDALDDREGVKERIVSRLDRYEARLARWMTQGITVLVTIGATAPLVGLFGTGLGHYEQLHRHCRDADQQPRRGRRTPGAGFRPCGGGAAVGQP